MGFWSRLFGAREEPKATPKAKPVESNQMPRRLNTFRDETLHNKVAFDHGTTQYDIVERNILNNAYSYLAKTLAANTEELRQLGLTKGDLIFDILDDRAVNAFASSKEGNDALCLNAGLPICLYLLFSRIAQFPGAFPWVGDPKIERRAPPSLDALPVSVTQLVMQAVKDPASGQPSLVAMIPADNERREFVMYVWKWSLLFVLLHELGHIVHGHVEHSLRSSGKPFAEITDGATERAAVSSSGKPPSTWFELRQGQERQADRFAVNLSFLPLYMNSQTLPPFLSTVTEGRFNKVPYTWGFALATIFTVFAFLEKQVRYDRTGITHPNPFERLATAAFTPGLLLLEITGESLPHMGTEIMGAWVDLDELLGMAFGQMFRGFFTQENPAIPLSIQNVARSYAHEEQWTQYDRIKKAHNASLRFAVFP